MAEACAARPVPPQSYAEYTGRVGPVGHSEAACPPGLSRARCFVYDDRVEEMR